MTKGQLLSKRDEFWDTAPAFVGRSEIWQALRAAAECEDMETAQAIMSAVDVTCVPSSVHTRINDALVRCSADVLKFVIFLGFCGVFCAL